MQTNPSSPGHRTQAPPQRAKRRFVRPVELRPDPVVRASEDGKTVFVALGGTYGTGKWMTLDASDWAEVRASHGDRWGWNLNGQRRNGRVVCGAGRLAHVARQNGERPTAVLARIIAGAKRGQVVCYRNGSGLDLRRANLAVLSQAEAARRLAALRRLSA
ncbi:hypothetical protein [Roseococcus pinisoli]|uniref:HNH endonuclease n=1 Tax=Roseococcus pinisoli TaxID=2835040 RepID=A0ABS5QC11_9PROT|nr:hypothetical protein [Roseococcus pinisoli]MBS7811229.1 hypothetical protein [Roseococcus pinisoli]